MSKPTPDDFSYLSDEDVKLLYDIVTTAEASNDTPFRALFAAYEQVLAEYGIAKDHDQIYLRFLLRMGKGRIEGEGLFERFESLLGKLGFQIDFVQEGEENDKNLGHRDGAGISRRYLQSTAPLEDTRRVTRRASFDSIYDTHADTKQPDAVSPPGSTSRPHSADIIHKSHHGPPSKVRHPLPLAAMAQAAPSQRIPSVPSRGRLRSEPRARELQHEPLPMAQVPTSRTRRDGWSANHMSEHASGLGSEDMSDASNKVSGVARLDALPTNTAPLETYRASFPRSVDMARMETHAKSLRYRHLVARAIGIFRRWQRIAEQSYHEHERNHQTALARDAETLKRQAFDHWRVALLQKRQQRDTEVFFENLECKATKARDLFLLTKAFTHWAQSASDEVLRTSAARRHVLRIRYFNAWRDIAVVNELKARRWSLNKFLSLWKRRTAQVVRQRERAALFYDHKAVDHFYRRWFWHFCERRAPAWYATKLKSSKFSRWTDSARHVQVMNAWALEFRSLELIRNFTLAWSKRFNVLRQCHDEAWTFRRRRLLQPAAKSLQEELRLVPLQSQTVREVDTRIARSVLRSWTDRTRATLQAARINDLRVMRNAWISWNDRLRCQALTRTIDDRVVLQALYKWVLAERHALCLRIHQEKLKRFTFSRWRDKTNSLCTSLGYAKQLFHQSRAQRSCSSLITRWSLLARAQRLLEARADDLRNEQLSVVSIDLWIGKWRHVQKLQTWSLDASFYIRASRSIKLWKTTTIAKQRTRRREAYGTIRRKVKMALARKILLKWHDAATAAAIQYQFASAHDQDHVITLGTDLFTTWRARATHVTNLSTHATAHRTHSLLSPNLTALLTRHADLTDSTARATAFLADSAAASASSCLRKLNWSLFQAKRLQQSAKSLEERSRRRHFRNMLRYWAERAAERSRPPNRRLFASPTVLTARHARFAAGSVAREDNGDHDEVDDAELPGFHPSLDAEPTDVNVVMQATPGYLRTPSRRTGKGARLLPGPRTPVTTTGLATGPATTGMVAHGTTYAGRLKGARGAPLFVGSASAEVRGGRFQRGGREGAGGVVGMAFEDVPKREVGGGG